MDFSSLSYCGEHWLLTTITLLPIYEDLALDIFNRASLQQFQQASKFCDPNALVQFQGTL